MALSAGTRLGRYEVRSKIGEGGMGEVYLARDTQLDRLVAVKILPAQIARDQPHESLGATNRRLRAEAIDELCFGTHLQLRLLKRWKTSCALPRHPDAR